MWLMAQECTCIVESRFNYPWSSLAWVAIPSSGRENVAFKSVRVNSKRGSVWQKPVAVRVQSIQLATKIIVRWLTGKTEHLATRLANTCPSANAALKWTEPIAGLVWGIIKSRLKYSSARCSHHGLTQCNTCLETGTWLSRELGNGKFYTWLRNVSLCAVGFLCRASTRIVLVWRPSPSIANWMARVSIGLSTIECDFVGPFVTT
jgi:hypothetical protein